MRGISDSDTCRYRHHRGLSWGVRIAATVILAAGATLAPLAQIPAAAGEGHTYDGLTASEPTGYQPSPSYYDISSGPATVNFDFTISNPPSSTAKALDNLYFQTNHILTYYHQDVSSGQDSIPAIVDGHFAEGSSHQTVYNQQALPPIVVPVGGSVSEHLTVVLSACGYYQMDVFNAPSGNLAGGVTRVLGCSKPTPTIVTKQSPGVVVGGAISDTATVGNGSPGATVSFALYGPNDSTCSGKNLVATMPAFNNLAVDSEGKVSSPAFTTGAAGTYRWVATYRGAQTRVGSDCQAEQVSVAKATGTISTTPQAASGATGGSFADTAKLSGGYAPTGTVSFSLYGPNDSTCSGPDLTLGKSGFKDLALTGSTASTQSMVLNTAGTYRWVATYSGDANNNPATSGCQAELVTVGGQVLGTSITTTPSPGGTVGESLSDSATVTGGNEAVSSGTVSFSLYGPGDSSCSGKDLVAAMSGFKNVTVANGRASSPRYTSQAAGTFRWVATYSGASGFGPSAGGCQAELVSVGKASPTLTTSPTPSSGAVGTAIQDSAALSGGYSPTGTVSFALYGPGDATCSGPDLLATEPTFKNVALADARALSPAFTTSAVGVYNWVVTYGGDTNNQAASSPCGAEQMTTGSVLAVTSSGPPLAPTGDNSLLLLLLAIPLLGAGAITLLVGRRLAAARR